MPAICFNTIWHEQGQLECCPHGMPQKHWVKHGLRISSMSHVAKHHMCKYTRVRLAWHHVSWLQPLTSHYTACVTLISTKQHSL